MTDIKIIVQGFLWNKNQVLNNYYKVNFYNTETSFAPFTDRLDITPFIIKDSISELTYRTGEIERAGKYNDLYQSASDMSFKVSDIIKFHGTIYGIESDYYLNTFFQIYEDTSCIKFLAEVYYQNKLIYIGFVNQDALEEELGLGSDTKQINVQLIGMEIEFKNFFENVKLKDVIYKLDGSWQNMNYGVIWEQENNNNAISMTAVSLQDFVYKIFKATPASGFRCEPDISAIKAVPSEGGGWGWYMFKRPHIHKSNAWNTIPASRFIWAHGGLETALENDDSCYIFLKKLCNAMGWYFSIYIKDTPASTKAYLTFKNRYSVNAPVYNITADKLLGEPSVKLKKQNTGDFCYMVSVPGGNFDLSYNLNSQTTNFDNGTDDDHFKLMGVRMYLASKFLENNFNADIFSNIILTGERYLPVKATKPLVRLAGDDKEFMTCDFVTVGIMPGQNSLNRFNHDKGYILRLDGGTCRPLSINLLNRHHYYPSGYGIGSQDIAWGGNYGGMMFYHRGSVPYHSNIYTYRDWTQGTTSQGLDKDDTFKKNLLSFLHQETNLTPEVSVKEVVLSPLISPQFAPETNLFPGKKFSVQEMTIDFNKKLTTFKLLNIY